MSGIPASVHIVRGWGIYNKHVEEGSPRSRMINLEECCGGQKLRMSMRRKRKRRRTQQCKHQKMGWKNANCPTPTPPLGRRTWSNPPEGWVKSNMDALVGLLGNHTGVGWLVRDHIGTFCAAKNLYHPSFHPLEEAEALATKEALNWLKDCP
ncbi:hypothetical protein DM860_008099 [Cuscuta australis]|uniref:RNase H type-1 domain-containing protein n=1 Tax=Cuscuta australis TaxID=267555 RepID=A0A328D6I8_9ASTE|nr:hypothetical protein DM860_008099 [Cuscuta australis]